MAASMTTPHEVIPHEAAPHVLIVESEPLMAQTLRRHLRRGGYQVTVVCNGVQAISAVQSHPPDLVVLDLVLPGTDGLGLFRRLRERCDVPVVMLSPNAGEADRVFALNLGADDFVPNPVSPQELLARVGCVLRRRNSGSQVPAVLRVGPLTVDERTRRVQVFGRPATLTALEFKLLVYLMRHADEVCSRETLLEQVWGFRWGETSTVTVHVRRLREKIEPDPAAPTLVRTVWGVGYRLEAPAS
ncbi:MAG: response regulator transcription factor [Egibacteraceae bacterium]